MFAAVLTQHSLALWRSVDGQLTVLAAEHATTCELHKRIQSSSWKAIVNKVRNAASGPNVPTEGAWRMSSFSRLVVLFCCSVGLSLDSSSIASVDAEHSVLVTGGQTDRECWQCLTRCFQSFLSPKPDARSEVLLLPPDPHR